MAIVRAAEAPHFEIPGTHFIGLLAPSRGSTELCTWRLEVEAGTGTDGRAHRLDHEEVFVVLEGSLAITIDGKEADLWPGDAAAVPANATLAVANRTNGLAKALVCIRAGFKASMVDGEDIGTPPWAL